MRAMLPRGKAWRESLEKLAINPSELADEWSQFRGSLLFPTTFGYCPGHKKSPVPPKAQGL